MTQTIIKWIFEVQQGGFGALEVCSHVLKVFIDCARHGAKAGGGRGMGEVGRVWFSQHVVLARAKIVCL